MFFYGMQQSVVVSPSPKNTVIKPWGREIWLEHNDFYCYKRIEIHAGHKTIFQFHERKTKTNYIISGDAEVWLENEKGVVEILKMKGGDFFTVSPQRKHRVVAITDLILQEVSTPQIDDGIQVTDDNERREQSSEFTPVVCILAAGLGTKMGKNTHNTLLPFKDKALLTHIIEKFNPSTHVVIAIGHLGEQIREYVDVMHADRHIEFVNVSPYHGVGSGPARSIDCCREKLQRPFYICASDFYTPTPIENLESDGVTANWLGLAPTKNPQDYSTVTVVTEQGEDICSELKNKMPVVVAEQKQEKGKKGAPVAVPVPVPSDSFWAFTGIAFIHDFSLFWKSLDSRSLFAQQTRKSLCDDRLALAPSSTTVDNSRSLAFAPSSTTVDNSRSTHELVDVFRSNMSEFSFHKKYIEWYDTGSWELYTKLLSQFGDDLDNSRSPALAPSSTNVDNTKQQWKYNKTVQLNGRSQQVDIFLKKIDNANQIQKLAERAKTLEPMTPHILHAGYTFLGYSFIPGKTLYECDDLRVYVNFLKKWEPAVASSRNHFQEEKEDWRRITVMSFYQSKTIERMRLLELNHTVFRNLNQIKKLTVVHSRPSLSHSQSVAATRSEQSVVAASRGGNQRADKPLSVVSFENCDLFSLVHKLPWREISWLALPTKQFHGDLQFNNIILSDSDSSFYFVDWREDFGMGKGPETDLTKIGDLYYDLAKLYSGMLINYRKLKTKEQVFLLTPVPNKSDEMILTLVTDTNLDNLLELFFIPMVNRLCLNFKHIQRLTGLIFLNMAPFCEDPELIMFLYLRAQLLIMGHEI
jgi:mannose-6-phosphate isomerase-like protein (cupin superfamily)